MMIAVDGDCFVASLRNSACQHLVGQIDENLDKLRLLVDDKGKILKEYSDFLLSHLDEQEEHPTIKLLQKIIFEKEEVILTFPSTISPQLQRLLKEHRCTTPLEPELISIAANAQHLGLKLLLTGDIHPILRDRRLNDQKVRRALQKEIPWLDVRFASERKPIFEEPEVMKYQARIFELQAAIHLQTHHPNLRCVETPQAVKTKLQESESENRGDIDLYGYEEDGETRTVWVGECKLREEGKERKKAITTKDIEQLQSNRKAVHEYESNRSDLVDPQIKIRALIISNAEDFHDDLTRQEAQKLGVEFWRAKLLSGWMTNVHWHITELIQK